MYASRIYFLIFLNFFITNGDKTHSKNCDIDTSVTGVVQYVCPPSPINTKISIHAYTHLLTIHCNNREVLDDIVLPRGNHSSINKLVMKKCPLPKNGFRSLLKRFNMSSLKESTFIMTNLTLKTEHFGGLEELNTLTLLESNIYDFDGNILKNTPNLSDNDSSVRLNKDFFEHFPNLTELSMISTNITSIPRQFFNKLFKLNKLLLRNNKIRSLDKGVLDELKNLSEFDISFNEIELIGEDIFKSLTNLTNLNFDKNKLKNISRKIFENSSNINRISLNDNPNIKLHGEVFSQFQELKEVYLSNNFLVNFSEDIFNGSTNLRIIYLSNNSLVTLEKHVFKGLTNLEELHLNGNNIKTLHSEVFSSLRNLKKLYLQYNQIERLHEELLRNMRNLLELNLSHNHITFVSRYELLSFQDPYMRKLKEIDLSYNKLWFYPSVLNNKKRMEKLNLGNNLIKRVQLMSMLAMKIPGSRNLVIDLDSNNITSIELDSSDMNEKRKSVTVIKITNNPIICDCNALNIARFLQEHHNLNNYVRFEPKEVKCSGSMDGKLLNEIKPSDLTCLIDKNCTKNRECDCLRRSFDSSLIVNCSSRGLTDIPELIPDELVKFNQTIVLLDGNRLKRGPGEHEGYGNITELYLQKNQVSNVTWIPLSLKVLNLSGNSFSSMDGHLLELLNKSSIEKLFLGYNPWRCDCSTSDFANYLRSHNKEVDSSQIRCMTTDKEIIKLNTNDLCSSNQMLILIISLSILMLFLSLTFGTSLYFIYKKKILIWLHDHRCCLSCIDPDEIDEDKTYDAFISYSHKDQEFVLDNIISILESGAEPYKLCFHVRDFIPGEYIRTQIMRSICESRRTIVVLSPSFLESVWGKLEFKTAHTEAMLEGRTRVIIIIYGDPDLEAIDDELKSHIKANTYVKWGDPWFWKKLRYALPRRKSKKRL